MKKFAFSLFILIILSKIGFSQADSTSLDSLWNMSLEELMNIEVAVTSTNQKFKVKEAPAVVTVITKEEIENMGARDLIDILRNIPGFSFGSDTEGQLGLFTNGISAQEGKTLLLLDGQVMDELLYSCNIFGNHIPVENIKQIEVMRGPGSAIYGDFAELAVINIITETGSQIKGIEAGGTFSATENYPVYGYSGFVNAGTKIKDFEFSAFGRYSNRPRSNLDYADIYGETFNMFENQIYSTNINLSAGYKGLNTRFIYDDYVSYVRDFEGENLSKPYESFFNTMLGEISYNTNISDRLSFLAKANYKSDQPWVFIENPVPVDTAIYWQYHQTVNRYKGTTQLNYNYQRLSLGIGIEAKYDKAQDNLGETFWNEKDIISYYSGSAIAQSGYKTKFANIILEARLENHSIYGFAFAPRLALTKEFKKINYKLLFNRAYRTPGIAAIDLNYYLHEDIGKPIIEPEYTNYANIFLGYKATKSLYFDINFYHAQIQNPIVYFIDEDGNEGYENYGTTGSYGLETTAMLKMKAIYLKAGYSYYFALSEANIETSLVPNKNGYFIGSAPHKANVLATFRITKKINFNTNAIFLSKRYGYDLYDEDNDIMLLNEYPETFLINTNFIFKNLLIKGLNINIATYNILNQTNYFIQAYDGWHPPIPDTGREFRISLKYKFQTK